MGKLNNLTKKTHRNLQDDLHKSTGAKCTILK